MSSEQTWRFDRALSAQEREALCAAAAAEDIRCEVRASERFGTTYVLAVAPGSQTGQAFAARHSASATYDPAVIALAIEPQTADALPALFDALGGDGAPAGVTACELREGALTIEFEPGRTSWRLVRACIDAELRRYASARRIELLSPLTLQMQTQIAADGLDAAEIVPARVLETYADSDR